MACIMNPAYNPQSLAEQDDGGGRYFIRLKNADLDTSNISN